MAKWEVSRINDTNRPWAVINDVGDIVCGSCTASDVDLIVEAVNAHDELVAALRHAISLVNELIKIINDEEIYDACVEKFKSFRR